MAVRIGFLTGARSEYGIAKNLLRQLDDDERFQLLVYPNGMHLLQTYGHTVDEIYQDGFQVAKEITTYEEKGQEKGQEFGESFKEIYETIRHEELEGVFVLGDRIEAYTAALAAHFVGIPVLHMGGGHLTKGALDNIYRFNISNLATLHFVVTSRCQERLSCQALIEADHVYHVGSLAVDSILQYKYDLPDLYESFPNLQGQKFALMTFHPTTSYQEPIPQLMEESINVICKEGYHVLVTYPNNDEGAKHIINVINYWRNAERIHVSESLGAERYYAALQECTFVIGNSSSGLVEAPYFYKPVLNIGRRQEGREKDPEIIDVPANKDDIKNRLSKEFTEGWQKRTCHYVFGDGHAAPSIVKILANYYQVV